MAEKGSILIVDDDEGIRRTLALILQKKGYHTETAATGREGLEKGRGSFFNVAILDIKLPDMEGTALITPLKETHPDITVIMSTAYASVDTAVKALNMGALAYLTKPVNMDEALAVIRDALDRQRLVAAKREAEESLARSEEQYRALFEESRDAFMTLAPPLWKFASANRACVAMFGARDLSELMSLAPWEVSPEFQPDGRLSVEKAPEMIETAMREGSHFFEWTHKRVDGEVFPATVFLTRIEPGGEALLQATVRDITDRKRAEEELINKEQFLTRVIDQSPFAIWISDAQGTLQKANPTLKRLLNLTDEQLVGVYNVLQDPLVEQQGLTELISTVYESSQTIQFACKWSGEDISTWDLKGSSMVDIEATMFPILDQNGTLTNAVNTWIDVTDRKRAEDMLAQKTEELVRSNAEMDRFVHTVSHDLKSPLVTLQGFAGHVAQDAEQGRVDRLPGFVERIKEATEHMGQIIDGLLDLSSIGRVANPSEHIAMTELIHDVAREHEIELDKSQVALEVQDNMPTINADRARIVQVFDNLLTNVLKHGLDTHEPRVSIGARDEGNEVRFFVRDNGPGIPAEYHGKVFDLFARLQTNSQGTGVGLAIVKQAVASLGGRVWLESEPGKGATFWVAFPKESIGILDTVHT